MLHEHVASMVRARLTACIATENADFCAFACSLASVPIFLGEALKRLGACSVSSSKAGSYPWSLSLDENLLDELREVLNKYVHASLPCTCTASA
jgi:hypothetical protein